MTNVTIELALLRLTWKLRKRVLPGRLGAIRRELRAHLRQSAGAVGREEALRRLGSIDELAAEYAEAEVDRPAWPRPVVGLVSALLLWMILVFADGRRLLSRHGIEERADFDPWSWTAGAPNGEVGLFTLAGDAEQGLLLDVEVHRLGYVLLPLLAFVLGARLWRALSRPTLMRPAA